MKGLFVSMAQHTYGGNMSLFLSPIEGAKAWLLSVAVEKLLKRIIHLGLAYLTGLGLSNYGLDVDPNKAAIGLFLLTEPLRNWLKLKFGAPL